MRYLLIALLVVMVLYWIGRLRARRPDAQESSPPPSAPDGEPMRQCAHCGAYFPESDAIQSPAGEVFCSRQHLLRHGGG